MKTITYRFWRQQDSFECLQRRHIWPGFERDGASRGVDSAGSERAEYLPDDLGDLLPDRQNH